MGVGVWEVRGVLFGEGCGEEVGEEGFGGVERPRAVCGAGLGDVVASAVLERVPWRVVGGGVLFL